MTCETTLPEPTKAQKRQPPPPLGAKDTGTVRVEEPTCLSQSVLWDLQRASYQSRGLAAWSEASAPHFMASNAFIARAYVRQVRAFLRDLAAQDRIDESAPIYVVELAAGSGRLGFSFLNAWLEQPSPLPERRICYVLTDFAESVIEFWRRHPQLKALAEHGVLDFARWDMEGGGSEEDDHLHLLESGVEIAPGNVRNPMVVVASDAFSSIRHDAFAVLEGQLIECRLTLDVPPGAPEDGGADLNLIRFGHDYRPVGLPYYEDDILDGLLEEYRRELTTGHVLLPVGAFRAVRTLAKLAERGLLLLSADMGSLRLEELRDAPPPRPSRHGSIALQVNYHALGRQVEALGGRVFQPRTAPSRLAVNAFLLGVDSDVPATRRAVAETLDGLGPDTFYVLKRRLDQLLQQHSDEMPLSDVLAYLKLTDWDTRAARLCLPRLHELTVAGLTPRERDTLADIAGRIWSAHLHLGEVFDLAFELGTLLESAFLHRQAIGFFKHSLERYGEHTATFFNLALCHFRLREWDLARQCDTRALELDPGNGSARDLSLKIDAAVENGSVADAGPVAVKDAAPSTKAYSSNLEHLRGELELLNLRLRKEVERWRATHPPEASQEELKGARLTDLGADVALDSLGDARELLTASDGDPLASLAPRADLHGRRERAALDAGVALRLPELARCLGLDEFERAAIVLALAPELDHRYERLFGYLNDDMQRRWPTVRLALRLFTSDPEERNVQAWKLDPQATLNARRLLRVVGEEGPFPVAERSRGLRLEGRTLGFLLDKPGELAADPLLAPFLEIHHGDGSAPAVGEKAVRTQLDELHTFLASHPRPAPILALDGPDALLVRHVAAHLTGGGLLVLRGATVASGDDSEDLVVRSLREVELTGAALLVENADALSPRALHRLLATDCSRPRLLASAEPWPLPETCHTAPVVTLHVPAPDQAGREELWRRALGDLAAGLDVAEVAARFRLKSAQVESVVQGLRTRQLDRRPEELTHEIFTACRARCFVPLDGLAEQVRSVHTWADLVVPASVKEKLRAIENWLRCRHVVYDDWGFGERISVGRGMAVMFAGSSGTGKTMAAGILGRALDLDLYRIDLSSVVSKYIGETEKNLAKIFDAAEAANAILFFDEADALFGKRSEVKDAHDRHANIEVSYLLQRMENHDGIAILASNIKDNLDVAFARRLQVVVEFPFPQSADREQIWRRLLSDQVPQAQDVDLEFLGKQFGLSGGSIKNCALNAALEAAAQKKPVEMRHLGRAVAREYEKLGKPVTSAVFGMYGH